MSQKKFCQFFSKISVPNLFYTKLNVTTPIKRVLDGFHSHSWIQNGIKHLSVIKNGFKNETNVTLKIFVKSVRWPILTPFFYFFFILDSFKRNLELYLLKIIFCLCLGVSKNVFIFFIPQKMTSQLKRSHFFSKLSNFLEVWN